MSSISVQSKAPASLGTIQYCLSTVIRMSKKHLGGICLYIWNTLTVALCKNGNRIISRYHKVADAEAAIHALKAQLVAQHVNFELERKTHRDREANLKKQLDEYKSKFLELEGRRPFLESLAKVGAAVRCRALEQAKGRRIFGEGKDKFTNIRGEVDIRSLRREISLVIGEMYKRTTVSIDWDISIYKRMRHCFVAFTRLNRVTPTSYIHPARPKRLSIYEVQCRFFSHSQSRLDLQATIPGFTPCFGSLEIW
ncbi:hypothetical protein EAE96_007898 [Botrytis aclada]|nr:hypothetical protein EAE96_007898 [Botrytis aclada]